MFFEKRPNSELFSRPSLGTLRWIREASGVCPPNRGFLPEASRTRKMPLPSLHCWFPKGTRVSNLLPRKLSVLQDGPLPDRHRHRGPVQAFSDSLHPLIFSTFQAGSTFYNLLKSHLDSLIMNEKDLCDLKTPKNLIESFDISVY